MKKPEIIKATLSLEVEIPQDWIDYVTGRHGELFGRPYQCGYWYGWMRGIEWNAKLGWLAFEFGDDKNIPPSSGAPASIKRLWKDPNGLLPYPWHRIDRKVAIASYLEGIKQFGIKWYGDENDDGPRHDFLIQSVLLGEIKYG